MHQVDVPGQALLQKDDCASDVGAQCLLFMRLAPIDVRSAGLPRAVDHHIRRELLQHGDDGRAVPDIDLRRQRIGIGAQEMLAQVAGGPKKESLHQDIIEETDVTEETEESLWLKSIMQSH